MAVWQVQCKCIQRTALGELCTVEVAILGRAFSDESNLAERQPEPRGARQNMRRRSRFMNSSLTLLLFCGSALAQQSQQQSAQVEDLTSMDIEDLMNIKVTSVSRTEEKLSRTASAVFVIGPEDIRDSGALNIPDLLRMVPGVDVAQLTSNTWAIGVRGFNGRFSNKLLVLLDGRAVYTPTFGGVFWCLLGRLEFASRGYREN
jgi:outer membrane receptor protein involved in Fe transport